MQVEPAPAVTNTLDSSFITGIARIDASDGSPRLVILLDLAEVIAA